jgi:AcrR family transcriptional regulator
VARVESMEPPGEMGARPRKVGRPPRISRSDIAAAVLEIGLADSSMKAVADHLGVSVPGLYHHVRNRRELLMLAAERRFSGLTLPEDHGQHWATWLREWARYSRSSLMGDSELFNQYLNGAVDADRMVEVSTGVIDVLTRRGFSADEAMSAWEVVGKCAVGSAVESLRQRAANRSGRPGPIEIRHAVETSMGVKADAGADAGAGPGAGAEVSGDLQVLEARFEEDLDIVLAGLAVSRGDDWTAIVQHR